MNYVYVGVACFAAGAIVARIYLARAINEVKTICHDTRGLVTLTHAKLDALMSAAKAKL